MNLHQIREEIRIEMSKAQPSEDRITELVQQRDALLAAEKPAKPLSGSEWNAHMLNATHG